MMDYLDTLSGVQNCLIIDSQAGGGHVQAANFIESHLKAKGLPTIRREFYTTCLGRVIGRFAINTWNDDQKNERINKVNAYSKFEFLFDILLAIPVFFSTWALIRKHKIEHIVDVQPIGLRAILHAARIENFVRSLFGSKLKQIKVSLVMTDLPTLQATNFLQPLRGLRDNDRRILEVITTDPLLTSGQNSEEFWKENARLPIKYVKNRQFPLRAEFLTNRNCTDTILPLSFRCHSVAAKSDLAKALHVKISDKETANCNDSLSINVESQDRIITIMLGSQASFDATIQYVEQLVRKLKTEGMIKPTKIFVCCGDPKPHEPSLIEAVYHKIDELDIPDSISIAPLSWQDATVLAPLMARSDITITRAGGLTAMELLTVATGQILIHSVPSKGRDLSIEQDEEELLKGMFIWESGNARYLKSKKGARIVLPECLPTNLFLQSQPNS